MLTAITKEGKLFTLIPSGNQQMKIEKIRKGSFYCPICKEPLILKAGEIRILHFSHKQNSDCLSASTEPESLPHLHGKLQLFRFFQDKGIKAELEYYLPTIKQRPDVLIKYHNHLYAIEYQCSSISRKVLTDRTNGYLNVGITPLWIIGGPPFQKRKGAHFYLSDLYWSMAHNHPQAGLSILSYCSSKKVFYSLSNMTPVSTKKITGVLREKPLSKSLLPLQFSIDDSPNIPSTWIREKRNWIENQVRHRQAYQNVFLQNLYLSKLNPFLLPSIIGLPVQYMEYFLSHAIEWQFYIYLDCFFDLKINERIALQFILQKMKGRIKSGHISRRGFIKQGIGDDEKPIRNYMDHLVSLGYFTAVRTDLYQLKRFISQPKTIEEAKEMEVENFRKIKRYSKPKPVNITYIDG